MKKADKYILLTVAILLVLSTLSVYLFKTHFSKPGAIAVITQNGTPIHKIDLKHVESPYEITTQSDHDGYNKISIQKDAIKITDANCPDKLCVRTGSLSYTGDIAVCLPHGLMIEIQEGETGELDSLSY